MEGNTASKTEQRPVATCKKCGTEVVINNYPLEWTFIDTTATARQKITYHCSTCEWEIGIKDVEAARSHINFDLEEIYRRLHGRKTWKHHNDA